MRLDEQIIGNRLVPVPNRSFISFDMKRIMTGQRDRGAGDSNRGYAGFHQSFFER